MKKKKSNKFKRMMKRTIRRIYRFQTSKGPKFRKIFWRRIGAIAVCLCALFVMISIKNAFADNGVQREKVYDYVYIDKGDTIWEIAEEYKTKEYKDVRKLVWEICEINNIKAADLRPGMVLKVPYYVDVIDGQHQ